MTTKTERRYYAVQWLAGKGVTTTERIPYGAPGGPGERTVPYCNVISFTTRAARDRWVDRGTPYRGQRDYREAATASSRIVAAAVRRMRRAPWSGAVEEASDERL